jgi:hypothetical protein
MLPSSHARTPRETETMTQEAPTGTAAAKGPRYCTSDLIAEVSLLDPSPRGRAEERDKEDAMNMRVRQLWAPVLST